VSGTDYAYHAAAFPSGARASRRRTRRLSTLRVAIIFLFCQTPVERRNPREVKLMNHVGAYAASAFMNSAQYLVESFIV
jgi:hypothetical protein